MAQADPPDPKGSASSSGGNQTPADIDAFGGYRARLLVSEIKLYHEAAVAAGRREGDLGRRLNGEIARARQLYEQRVPQRVRAHAGLLPRRTRANAGEWRRRAPRSEKLSRDRGCRNADAICRTFCLLTIGLTLLASGTSPRAQSPAPAIARDPVLLKPTNHPRLPSDPADVWLVPVQPAVARTAAVNDFVNAVKLEVDSNFAKALPILSQPAVQQGTLGFYAVYYQGLAELRTGHPADARKTFRSLAAKNPVGYLVEATALREAECAEALGNESAAMEIYTRLAAGRTTAPDDVLLRLGRAARAAGDLQRATEAFERVIYEFPFSDLALVASAEVETLPLAPISAGSARYKLELGRAERLFVAKRYPQARQAFEGVKAASQGDDRELVTIRLAECDFLQKRPRNARDALEPYIDHAARQGEAL